MEKKELIIFLDSGDTIVEEGTQVWEDGIVTSTELIEGAEEMLRGLYESGYRIALVADGMTKSFDNVYGHYNLNHVFETRVISEEEGVEKPHRQMFEQAMERMGLTEADKYRIVMIGNNMKRDVLGANELGLTTILVTYSPRYDMNPETEMETPDYKVKMPTELTGLLDALNNRLLQSQTEKGTNRILKTLKA